MSSNYTLDELVKGLNQLRKAFDLLGEDGGYLTALDDVAEYMGISSEKVYKV